MTKVFNLITSYYLLKTFKKRPVQSDQIERLVCLIKKPQFSNQSYELFKSYFEIFQDRQFIDNPDLKKHFYHNLEYFSHLQLTEDQKRDVFFTIISAYDRIMEIKPEENEFFMEKMISFLYTMNFDFKNYDYMKWYQTGSEYFWNICLKKRINSLKNLKVTFKNISWMGYDFQVSYKKTDEFICSNVVEQFSVEELLKYGFNFPYKIDSKLNYLIVDSVYLAKNPSEEWVSVLLQSDLTERQMRYLLKIYKKDQRIRDYFLSNERNNLLRDLIVNNYDLVFDKNNYAHLEILRYCLNFKNFLEESLGKNSKKITATVSSRVYPKFDLGIYDLLDLCRDMDVNHVYKVLEKINGHSSGFYLDSKEKIWFKSLLKECSPSKQITYIVDAYNDVFTAKLVCSYLEKVDLRQVNLKECPRLAKLYEGLEIAFQRGDKKLLNLNLDQESKYPVLKKLQGYVIDDLRFEVPNHSNELFVYSVKMQNCIYRDYAIKCHLNSSILIGVYKDEKLTYNIEVGLNYINLSDLSVFTQDYLGRESIKIFPQINNMKKLGILNLEKKMREPVPEVDKKKIHDVLRSINLIG